MHQYNCATVHAKATLPTEAVLVPVAMTNIAVITRDTLEPDKDYDRWSPGGRLPALDHGSVSRRHAEISYANGQYVLHDMGSTNGTFVNDTAC